MIRDKEFLNQYFLEMEKALRDSEVVDQICGCRDILIDVRARNAKVILIGNGGSAALAGHFAVDLSKNAKVRAISFNDSSLLTCFSNDFGYEHTFEKCIEHFALPGDLLVAISSSGRSKNILNAVDAAKRLRLGVITLTGFSPDNPLRALGDVNLYFASRAYNIVESAHHIWLAAICDLTIGKAEYSV